MDSLIKEIEIKKAYRLLNVGGTSLISASHNGVDDVMPATWVIPSNVDPFVAFACIDKPHFTRPLIEKSGYFAMMLPTVSIVKTVMKLGWESKNDNPLKVEQSGAELFKIGDFAMPMVKGCAAYMVFKVIDEPHMQQAYDMFAGQCVAAYADERVYRNNHWEFENADPSLSTLHYVAGGHFYGIGPVVEVPGYEEE